MRKSSYIWGGVAHADTISIVRKFDHRATSLGIILHQQCRIQPSMRMCGRACVDNVEKRLINYAGIDNAAEYCQCGPNVKGTFVEETICRQSGKEPAPTMWERVDNVEKSLDRQWGKEPISTISNRAFMGNVEKSISRQCRKTYYRQGVNNTYINNAAKSLLRHCVSTMWKRTYIENVERT